MQLWLLQTYLGGLRMASVLQRSHAAWFEPSGPRIKGNLHFVLRSVRKWRSL